MVFHEFVSNNVDTYANFSLLLMLVLFGLITDLMLSMMRIFVVIVWLVGGLRVGGLGVFRVGAVFYVFRVCFRYPFILTSFKHILISLSSTFP